MSKIGEESAFTVYVISQSGPLKDHWIHAGEAYNLPDGQGLEIRLAAGIKKIGGKIVLSTKPYVSNIASQPLAPCSNAHDRPDLQLVVK